MEGRLPFPSYLLIQCNSSPFMRCQCTATAVVCDQEEQRGARGAEGSSRSSWEMEEQWGSGGDKEEGTCSGHLEVGRKKRSGGKVEQVVGNQCWGQ